MQSATDSGKKCGHMIESSTLIGYGLPGYFRKKKEISCAKALGALLILRRDLRTYFMKKHSEPVYNYERIRILGVGRKLSNAVYDDFIQLENKRGYDDFCIFLNTLLTRIFHRYACNWFDRVNDFLDAYIDSLEETLKGHGYTEDDLEHIFQAGNIPEDFCSGFVGFSAGFFAKKISKDLGKIIFYRGKEISCNSGRDHDFSYFASGDVTYLSEFCDKRGWDFCELNPLIDNLFSRICQYLAWRFFAHEISGPTSREKGSKCLGSTYLFRREGAYNCVIYGENVLPCVEYFKRCILKEDMVNLTSQKKIPTVLGSFAAAPDEKGDDYDLVRESYLEDAELEKTTKSSPYSIDGENSSGIGQQSSDLLSEEVEVGLIYSSKNDSIGSTALFKNSPIVRKKRKALQGGEEIEPKFKKVVVEEIEGAKRAAEQEMQLIKDYEGVDRCTSSSRSPSYYINEVLSGGLGLSTNTLIRK